MEQLPLPPGQRYGVQEWEVRNLGDRKRAGEREGRYVGGIVGEMERERGR